MYSNFTQVDCRDGEMASSQPFQFQHAIPVSCGTTCCEFPGSSHLPTILLYFGILKTSFNVHHPVDLLTQSHRVLF